MLNAYRSGGLSKLLENNIAERGRREWVNTEAWQALQEALAQGEIATYKQAQELLAKHAVVYKDETGVLRLFKRHQIKPRRDATATRRRTPWRKKTLKNLR